MALGVIWTVSINAGKKALKTITTIKWPPHFCTFTLSDQESQKHRIAILKIFFMLFLNQYLMLCCIFYNNSSWLKQYIILSWSFSVFQARTHYLFSIIGKVSINLVCTWHFMNRSVSSMLSAVLMQNKLLGLLITVQKYFQYYLPHFSIDF